MLGVGAALLIGALVALALAFLRGGLDHNVAATLATPADDVPLDLPAAARSAEEPEPTVGLGAASASEPASAGPAASAPSNANAGTANSAPSNANAGTADSAPSSVAKERAALGQSRPK